MFDSHARSPRHSKGKGGAAACKMIQRQAPKAHGQLAARLAERRDEEEGEEAGRQRARRLFSEGNGAPRAYARGRVTQRACLFGPSSKTSSHLREHTPPTFITLGRRVLPPLVNGLTPTHQHIGNQHNRLFSALAMSLTTHGTPLLLPHQAQPQYCS